jgi:hypothetical protein
VVPQLAGSQLASRSLKFDEEHLAQRSSNKFIRDIAVARGDELFGLPTLRETAIKVFSNVALFNNFLHFALSARLRSMRAL